MRPSRNRRRRSRLVDGPKFKASKGFRAFHLGPMCELCEERNATCGHHVFDLTKNDWNHIQIRCDVCETYWHQVTQKGNSDYTMRVFYRNNASIGKRLAQTR